MRSGPLPPGTPNASAPGTRLALGGRKQGGDSLLDALTCLAVRPVRGQHSRFLGSTPQLRRPSCSPPFRLTPRQVCCPYCAPAYDLDPALPTCNDAIVSAS